MDESDWKLPYAPTNATGKTTQADVDAMQRASGLWSPSSKKQIRDQKDTGGSVSGS